MIELWEKICGRNEYVSIESNKVKLGLSLASGKLIAWTIFLRSSMMVHVPMNFKIALDRWNMSSISFFVSFCACILVNKNPSIPSLWNGLDKCQACAAYLCTIEPSQQWFIYFCFISQRQKAEGWLRWLRWKRGTPMIAPALFPTFLLCPSLFRL